MKKSIILLPVLLFFCLLLTCDIRQKSILEEYIPPDALVVVQVQHPDTFFKNMDAFLKPLGGIPLMGDVPVKDFLKSIVEPGSPLKFEWFDFAKPWGGALLSPQTFFYNFPIIICIPLLPKADKKEIEKYAVLMGLYIEFMKDYILLSNQKRAGSKKNGEKIDLSRLQAFDKGALTCQVNIPYILTATGMNRELITNLLKRIPGLEDALDGQKGMEMVMGFLVKLFEAIEQIEEISTGILFNDKGISNNTFMHISEQGWMNDCLSTLTRKSDIKEYFKYIPRDYLFSMISNLNNDFLLDITERYYNFILPYSEIDTEDADKLLDTVKKSIKASERRTAFALNIHTPVPGSQEQADSLATTFSASLLSAIELKDTKAYRSAIEELSKNKGINQIVNSYLSKAGNFLIEYSKNRQKDNVTYDEIDYIIEMDQTPGNEKEKSGYMDTVKQLSFLALKEFLKNIKLYLGYNKNHCYIVSGKPGIEQLKNLLENDKYSGETLQETDVYTHFAAEIPRDAHLAGHFSMQQLISMVPGMPEFEKKAGLLFYGKYDNALFESGSYWDIGEIKLLYNQLFTFMPQLMEGIPQF